MCSCKLEHEKKYEWINACDQYDRLHDVAIWKGDDPRKTVRYNTLTAQCGLFSWNFVERAWIMEKELPVTVHDPVAVKQLAERMLR